jgi:hypothetical protein
MKKLLLFLLTILLPTVANAYDACIDDIYYNFDQTAKTATVTYYSSGNYNQYGYSGTVNIPATVDYNGETYSVTSIGNLAFRYCSGLSAVTIPNSVTSIGQYAFFETGWYNSQPDGVLYLDNWLIGYKGEKPTGAFVITEGTRGIAYYAFESCSGLTSVTIPNSVTTIGSNAFYGCSNLTTVAIPNGVTSIGSSAFDCCSNLTAVTIPNSVTSIGSYAFYGCSGLTSVTIPDGIKNIENGTFSGCSGLTSVTLPDGITSIGSYAFNQCSGLTSVTLPDGITSIGSYAFSQCSGLTSITIPNGVITIGDGAFSFCWDLEILKLPDELQTIKKEAFKWCSKLKSLTIPATVEYIYSEAFSGCDALESIKALPETPPFLYDNSFSNYSVPLLVPDGCKEAYQNAQGWKHFTNISDSKYQLTYLVDGEEYKSYIVEYGTPITPEAEPTKETYKFSGWSDIPETMPNHDVIVTGTFTRYFDVGNLTKAVNFVMKSNASAEETVLYDLNNNEKMDVGDVILIVKFILNNIYNAPSYIGRRAGEVTDLSQFTAAQFEIKTTSNTEIHLVKSMEQTHQLMYQQKDANTYAVVVYSLSNQLMQPENGKIIETNINSDILSIENVTVATPTGETAYYQTLSATTGIEQIENENGTAVIYNLKGNRLNNEKALNKGIYIVNGKKTVVR